PLFAGLAGRPWPSDELGGLWHACALLRELRGDSHVAAFVAAGVSGLEANILTELQVGWPPLAYTATRGWSDEAMEAATWRLTERGLIAGGALTPAGSRLRAGHRGRHRPAAGARADCHRPGAAGPAAAARGMGAAGHRARLVPARPLQARFRLSAPLAGPLTGTGRRVRPPARGTRAVGSRSSG
ncbi:MAG: hypothetical protein M3Y33_10545, partial [Actinomycetota bacterium]|nr:hypothetical protein [Actinomycetota bacterium]